MFSWTQTSAGCPFGAAQLQRLEDEGRDVEVTHPAAVGDLVHLHEAVARGAPGLVGLRLLLQHAIEVRLALLGQAAEWNDREDDGQEDERDEKTTP